MRGAIRAVRAVSGLLALLFFTTFNNFLGGVFMALMDPYGLTLVSVEAWGLLLGVVSFGFIAGGLTVARKGLGSNPTRTLLRTNAVLWIICIVFPIRSSIVLLVIGFVLYTALIPVVEASEQTIIQRVVPFNEQGRVFGFAQMLETGASPITAFLIGPIAQVWVIPFMTDGGGADSVGSWFGTGPDRGMALVFMVAGVIGLVVTLLAMQTRSYRDLSARFAESGSAGNPPKRSKPPTNRGREHSTRRTRAPAGWFWLATVRPDGTPHVMPVFAAWSDPVVYVASKESARKSRNLDADERCVLTTDTGDLHLVVEGRARRVRDEPGLARASTAFEAIYSWPTEVTGDLLDAEYGAPTSGGPPYAVFAISPTKAFAFPRTANRPHRPAGASTSERPNRRSTGHRPSPPLRSRSGVCVSCRRLLSCWRHGAVSGRVGETRRAPHRLPGDR